MVTLLLHTNHAQERAHLDALNGDKDFGDIVGVAEKSLCAAVVAHRLQQGQGRQLFAGMQPWRGFGRKWFYGRAWPVAAAQVNVCAVMTVIALKESPCNCGSRDT